MRIKDELDYLVEHVLDKMEEYSIYLDSDSPERDVRSLLKECLGKSDLDEIAKVLK